MVDRDINQPKVRTAVLLVLLLNFSYFFVEFSFAFFVESVSLFADSIDFLEDSALNFLILLSLGASAVARRRVSRLLAVLMLVPAGGGAWMAVSKILDPTPPVAGWMTLVGLGALVVNLSCALVMARFRQTESGLLLAAFFSARNDALANVGIIIAGIVTLLWASAVPDILVGLIIMALNADSAYKIWTATTREARRVAP